MPAAYIITARAATLRPSNAEVSLKHAHQIFISISKFIKKTNNAYIPWQLSINLASNHWQL